MTDNVLLEMNTRAFNEAQLLTTVTRREIDGDERLILTQPADRDYIDTDDQIILDHDAQHALYLLLKNRFE
jgi:hypothetical protein